MARLDLSLLREIPVNGLSIYLASACNNILGHCLCSELLSRRNYGQGKQSLHMRLCEAPSSWWSLFNAHRRRYAFLALILN